MSKQNFMPEAESRVISITYKKIEGSEVLETKKYELFSMDIKNRPVSEEKVNFFVKQFKQGKIYLYEFPIMVDDKMLILDGQHRFEALKKMDMPVYFRYAKTLKIESVTDVQTNSGWKQSDYLHAFIKQKNQNYIILNRFVEKYKISLSIAVLLLNGSDGGRNKSLKGLGFYEGTFTVKTETKAHRQASAINKIGEASGGFNRHMPFCQAVISIINHPDYEEKRMMEQLEKYSSLMKRHMTIENYIKNIEDVYNYHLTNKNRVRFI